MLTPSVAKWTSRQGSLNDSDIAGVPVTVLPSGTAELFRVVEQSEASETTGMKWLSLIQKTFDGKQN